MAVFSIFAIKTGNEVSMLPSPKGLQDRCKEKGADTSASRRCYRKLNTYVARGMGRCPTCWSTNTRAAFRVFRKGILEQDTDAARYASDAWHPLCKKHNAVFVLRM